MPHTEPVDIVVGVAEMVAFRAGECSRLTALALGSCVGVSIYDPVALAGGLLHFMLPQPGSDANGAELNPAMYATTGVPVLFRKLEQLGLQRQRAVVCVAGGAEVRGDASVFAIGKRNHTMLRKMFWKDGTRVAAEDIGGNQARTMLVEMADGEVRIKTPAGERVLWSRGNAPAGSGGKR
jgi:chemotaxis protein CheD